MKESVLKDKRVVAILALVVCLLWGSAFPGIKQGYTLFGIGREDLPDILLFAGYRFTLAGVLILIFATVTGKKIFRLHGQDYLRLTIMGLMMTTIQYLFFYIGLSHTTGVKGAIVTSVNTFFYVILGFIAFKDEKLNASIILGCIIGFLGVVVANMGKDLGSGMSLAGEGCMALAALAQALAGIYGKILTRTLDPVVMTAWQLTIGGAMLVLIGFATGGALHGFTPTSTALLLYLALVSSVAFALLAVLLKYNPVSMISVYQFTTPLFGASLSALFLGEKLLEWKYLAALLLVSLGIFLVSYVGTHVGAGKAK